MQKNAAAVSKQLPLDLMAQTLLTAAAAWFSPLALMPAVLVLGWVLTSAVSVKRGTLCICLPAAAAAAAVFSKPGWLAPLWIAWAVLGCGAALCRSKPDWRARALPWAAAAGISWGVLGLCVSITWNCTVWEWLAGVIRQKAESFNAMQLANLWRIGLAPYGSRGEQLPAVALGRVVLMSREVREELLRGLYGNALTLGQRLILKAAGASAVLIPWACVVIQDRTRRRLGSSKLLLPPAESWYIPRSRCWGVLGAMIAAAYLSLVSRSAWGMMAAMIGWALYSLFCIQGACWLMERLKRRGAGRSGRRMLIAALALMFPAALYLMSLLDLMGSEAPEAAGSLFEKREIRRKEAEELRKKEGEDE